MKEPNIISIKRSPIEIEEWIGIGSIIYDSNNPEERLLPSDKSDKGWLAFINGSSPLEILHAMNYLLLTDSWTEHMPQPLATMVLGDHIDEIKEVLANWFHEGTELFKFLDFTTEEINNYEIVNHNDVDLNQMFIPKSMLERLNSDINRLARIFKVE